MRMSVVLIYASLIVLVPHYLRYFEAYLFN